MSSVGSSGGKAGGKDACARGLGFIQQGSQEREARAGGGQPGEGKRLARV